MHKFLRCIITSATLCILAGCSFHQKKFFRRKLYFVNQKPAACRPTTTCEPTITIWVHGACPFGANTYNLGLKSPALFTPTDYIARGINTLIQANSHMFPPDHVYIYSWSGILDFSERQKAAHILYQELSQVIESYKKLHGITPKIRILAHSHGGNVTLNLAAIPNNNLVIDELILLAVPVQTKNQDLVHSPLFKQVFSLYSTIDIPQIIDPQLFYRESGTYAIFSGQRFKPARNLMQVKIKINGTACQHLQFNDIPTLKILPTIIDQLNQWMDTIPQDTLLSEDTRFMLSVYTNGRRTPRLKRYRSCDPCEHKELAY